MWTLRVQAGGTLVRDSILSSELPPSSWDSSHSDQIPKLELLGKFKSRGSRGAVSEGSEGCVSAHL